MTVEQLSGSAGTWIKCNNIFVVEKLPSASDGKLSVFVNPNFTVLLTQLYYLTPIK